MTDRRKSFLKRIGLPKDPLLRLLAVNGMLGVGVSGLFLAGIFAANIGNLRTLVVHAENPLLPVVLLGAGFVITLASVVMGSAVMLLPGEDKGRGGSGRIVGPSESRNLQPALIPVRVTERRQRLD